MTYQLFNYQNGDNTREYLKKEYDIGVNLPCIHFEEPKHGQDTFRFVIGVYTYTHKGLYAIEGVAVNDRVGKGGILSSGIITIFEQQQAGIVKHAHNWLCDNIRWLYDIETKRRIT